MARALGFERVEVFIRLPNGHIVSGLLFRVVTTILTVDDTNGTSEQLVTPTFADIETAILSLDGTTRTQVGLFIDEETFIQVGGSKELCTCSIRMNGKLHLLVDPELSGDEFVWVVSGQGDEVPRNECFKSTDVIRVVKLFWEQRKLSEEFEWKSF